MKANFQTTSQENKFVILFYKGTPEQEAITIIFRLTIFS